MKGQFNIVFLVYNIIAMLLPLFPFLLSSSLALRNPTFSGFSGFITPPLLLQYLTDNWGTNSSEQTIEGKLFVYSEKHAK